MLPKMTSQIDTAKLLESVETVRGYRRESLSRVARGLGISPSTFSRLREGRQPSLRAYVAILGYLGREAPFLRRTP